MPKDEKPFYFYDDLLTKYGASRGILGSKNGINENYEPVVLPVLEHDMSNTITRKKAVMFAGNISESKVLGQVSKAVEHFDNLGHDCEDEIEAGKYYSIADKFKQLCNIMKAVRAQGGDMLYAEDVQKDKRHRYNPDHFVYNGSINLFIGNASKTALPILAVTDYKLSAIDGLIRELRFATPEANELLKKVESAFELDKYKKEDFNHVKDCRKIASGDRFKELKGIMINRRNFYKDQARNAGDDVELAELAKDNLILIRQISRFMLFTKKHGNAEVYVVGKDGQPDEIFKPELKNYPKNTVICVLDDKNEAHTQIKLQEFTREFISDIAEMLDVNGKSEGVMRAIIESTLKPRPISAKRTLV